MPAPKETLVADVMTPDPIAIAPETPVREAYVMMRERDFRQLPVVDASGALVGVLSMADIGRAGASVSSVMQQPTSVWMTREPQRVTPETTIEVAAVTMAAHKSNCLVVCDASGALTGIITTYDLLDALARRLRAEH